MSYKFRIYPTLQQKEVLDNTIETCRLLYNECLEERKKEHISRYAQQKRIVVKKKTRKDLQIVYSQVIQDVAFRVDKSFQRFFSKQRNYPRFKRYGRYNSITYPQKGFQIKNNKLWLSKIGYIKIKIHRIPVGTIKTCNIIRNIDKWSICLITTNSVKKISNNESIGIDVGITNWLTLSNGEVINKPHYISKSLDKVNRLRKEFSRKKKGSKNREKARIRLAKAWRKVSIQREDYCHKVSSYLAKKYGLIIFEKLRMENMAKQHTLAISINDSVWSKLKRLAAYKAEVIEVNPYNTTQICSNCERKQEVKIGSADRVYNCQYCGLILDRDVNAAKNILKLGQELALVERKPLASSNEGVKFLSMKQETTELNQ